MPVDLAALVAPERTAVVTSEVQNGVVGERSALPRSPRRPEQEMLPSLRRLLPARAGGRRAGGALHRLPARRRQGRQHQRPAVHGRAEVAGASCCRARRRSRCSPTSVPSPRTSCSPAPTGSTRWRGTDLDPVLRNLGVRTIVVTGVSVNVAITNLVMDAVNRGYDVVLPARRGVRHPAGLRRRGDRQHARPAGHHHDHRRAPGGVVVSDGDGDGDPWRPRVGHHAGARALGGRALRRRRGARRRRRAAHLPPSSPTAVVDAGRAFIAAGRRAGRPGGDLVAQRVGVGRRGARPAVGRRRGRAHQHPVQGRRGGLPPRPQPRPASSSPSTASSATTTSACSTATTCRTSSTRSCCAATCPPAPPSWADFVGRRRPASTAARSTPGWRRSRPTTSPTSSSRAAPPGTRRARCARTARWCGPSPTGRRSWGCATATATS